MHRPHLIQPDPPGGSASSPGRTDDGGRPRLEFRQTQSLVMTPQLRQAIKLLQFTNLEVAAFVEEELERNPLLERDERSELVSTRPRRRTSSPSETMPRLDTADLTAAATLPERGADPLDVNEHAERYDAGGAGDGEPPPSPALAAAARMISAMTGATCEDMARKPAQPARASRRAAPPRLRRPGRPDHRRAPDRPALPGRPADRRAGRDRAGDGRRAGARRGGARAHDALRPGRPVRPRPARVPGRPARRAQPARPGDGRRCSTIWTALARRDLRQLMSVCGVDAEDLADMIAEIRAARSRSRAPPSKPRRCSR